MKRLLLTVCILRSALCAYAGTNAFVTFSTNNNTLTSPTNLIIPATVWQANSNALNAVVNTNNLGGAVNSNAFVAATNGNAATLTNAQATNINNSTPANLTNVNNTIGGDGYSATQWGELFYTVIQATQTNVPTALVQRDSSGNFAAGTITANLIGISSAATNAGYATNAGAAVNVTGGGTGNNLTNLNSWGTLTLQGTVTGAITDPNGNYLSLEANLEARDGAETLLTNINYFQGIWCDETGNMNFFVAPDYLHENWTSANFSFNPGAGCGFSYIQNGGNFTLAGAEAAGYPELMDLNAYSFAVPYASDLLVWAGNSNSYTGILGTQGTIQCVGVWQPFTNITSNFTNDMADRVDYVNPTSGNIQITVPPVMLGFSQVPPEIQGTITNWERWKYQNAAIGGGSGKMPLYSTLDFIIENCGNTSHTVSVCSVDHAWFTNNGRTNLIIPNETEACLMTDGTNIYALFRPTTPNIGAGWSLNGANGAGLTNVPETGIVGNHRIQYPNNTSLSVGTAFTGTGTTIGYGAGTNNCDEYFIVNITNGSGSGAQGTMFTNTFSTVFSSPPVAMFCAASTNDLSLLFGGLCFITTSTTNCILWNNSSAEPSGSGSVYSFAVQVRGF